MYASKAVFPQNFVQEKTRKTIFHFPRHTFVNVYRPAERRQLVTHRDYSPTANWRTQFPRYFEWYLELLRGVLGFLCTYCTISRRTPKDNSPNHRWKTLVSIDGICE
jgi:hypothetical protein